MERKSWERVLGFVLYWERGGGEGAGSGQVEGRPVCGPKRCEKGIMGLLWSFKVKGRFEVAFSAILHVLNSAEIFHDQRSLAVGALVKGCQNLMLQGSKSKTWVSVIALTHNYHSALITLFPVLPTLTYFFSKTFTQISRATRDLNGLSCAPCVTPNLGVIGGAKPTIV